MRIIRQGVLPEKIEHQATCSNCMTVFAATRDEFKPGGDMRESWYEITCPFCKITLTFGSLPEQIKKGNNNPIW